MSPTDPGRAWRSKKVTLFLAFNDHAPPHLHVRRTAQEKGRILLNPVRYWDGTLSPQTRKLAERWATRWEAELLANWYLLRARETDAVLVPIPGPEE